MEDLTLWWAGWDPIIRIGVIGTLGYVWLVLLLRTTGPRNMAKMTPFDFVLTVTLGSAFGRVLTARDITLSEGIAAFTLLVALQWLLAYLRRSSRGFTKLVDPGPTLLFHDGRPVEKAMRQHRFTESDLHSAARENGLGSLEEVAVVILQADGTFAVIPASAMGDGSAVKPYVGS